MVLKSLQNCVANLTRVQENVKALQNSQHNEMAILANALVSLQENDQFPEAVTFVFFTHYGKF